MKTKLAFSSSTIALFFLGATGFCYPTSLAWAESSDQTALVQADRLAYDEETGIVTAAGHVEISRGNRILKADKVSYDKIKEIVHAEGNVVLFQEDSDTVFAEKTELKGDMKDGFIEKVGLLFADHSRLAAAEAERFEGRYLVVYKGVYSACELCKENPDNPPLWQVRAARITHDNEKKDIIYRDAIVEIYGIPVFYSPYISHPDPSVKRRQGFLSPNMGYNRNLGTFVRTPYYFDNAPNDDLVITPTFSAVDKFQFGANWRHRFDHGRMEWRTSLTNAKFINEYGLDKGKQWRGHLFGDTRFDLNDIWRMGTDIAVTTDKSYLQRYKITSEDVLLNKAYIEGFQNRNYASTKVYYFQDLRPGSRLTEPVVAPEIKVSALGSPGATFGGRWSLNSGLLVTSRKKSENKLEQGPDTRRLSLDAGWERQFISSTGFLTTVSGFGRMDGYWAEHVPNSDAAQSFSNIAKARSFAQGDLSLRYPFGRRGDGYQHIVEPISVLSVAPKVRETNKLPNEDSLDVEFDETNLFANNRFTGIDRIEGGTRLAYGVRNALVGDNGARIEFLGGQVYRMDDDPMFPENSGLRQQQSDYVGRFDFAPASWVDLNYGFRIDQRTLSFQKQAIQAIGGVPEFTPHINYILAKQSAATTSPASPTVEEGTLGFRSQFAKHWTLAGTYRHAFRPNPGPRTTAMNLTYQDECFQYGLSGQRDHTNRVDFRSGTTFMFHFYLKNIGGIHTDSVTNGAFMQQRLPALTESDKSTMEQP